jgi:GDP/UDP-N,N'-diacetylbacillosamine 2-epimerase (hydrolysing)
MKKLLFVLGSRGEWGYIKPVIEISKEFGFHSEVCVTNMMLLPKHGDLLNEIMVDGIDVSSRILSAVSGDSREAMAKSIGLVTQSFTDTLISRRPDWVILSGDRAEQLGAAIASTFMYIPTAHIQAGERSGSIDGVTRHAITKLVHLHFASNDDAADRLIKMGEQSFRVIKSGAPQIDSIVRSTRLSLENLISSNYVSEVKYALICFHPVTEDFHEIDWQINFLLDLANKISISKIWILPNNDPGGDKIREKILANKKIEDKAFANLPRHIYLSLMEHAQYMLGNSSSGILEAPSFKTPVINIGRRQHGRVSEKNVIHVDFSIEACLAAIKLISNQDFKSALKHIINPYGDGTASAKILTNLANIKISQEFLVKTIAY